MIEFKLSRVYPGAQKWEDKPVVLVADCERLAEINERPLSEEQFAQVLALLLSGFFASEVRWNHEWSNQGHYVGG